MRRTLFPQSPLLPQPLVVLSIVILLALLLLSGCFPTYDGEEGPPKVTINVNGEQPQAPPAATAPIEEPAAAAPEPASAAPQPSQASPEPAPIVPPPVQQPPAQPTAPEEQVQQAPRYGEGISPISPIGSQEWMEIGTLNARRTSRDKGELKEMDIMVRNIGTYAFYPVIYMTFEYGLVGDSETPRIVEQKFELPQLKPGLQITRTFPVSVRFHEIDKSKTIKLRMQEKYISPPYDFAKTGKTFIPRDEFKTQDIKWT